MGVLGECGIGCSGVEAESVTPSAVAEESAMVSEEASVVGADGESERWTFGDGESLR